MGCIQGWVDWPMRKKAQSGIGKLSSRRTGSKSASAQNKMLRRRSRSRGRTDWARREKRPSEGSAGNSEP